VTGRLTRGRGGPARLRELLTSGRTIVAPGAFDPLAARLVEEAGFRAVYMTGFGTGTLLAAMRAILKEIATAGTPAGALAGLPSFGEFLDFIGLPEVRAAEQRYASGS
jgi:2-methylisocitrate lyase-like PEP mutase family enzyme